MIYMLHDSIKSRLAVMIKLPVAFRSDASSSSVLLNPLLSSCTRFEFLSKPIVLKCLLNSTARGNPTQSNDCYTRAIFV